MCICLRVRARVCVAVVHGEGLGTPLRSSLVATGCEMRRAEKTNRAACFDSQTRAAAEDGAVWKSVHALRLSAGRKQANEDAHRRENCSEFIFISHDRRCRGWCLDSS